MMFNVLMYANVSTDGVYDTYKVWLWVCREGQERLLRHITAACDQQTIMLLREGCKKSKWKFKRAFAMKGGGVSRGSRLPLSYFEK